MTLGEGGKSTVLKSIRGRICYYSHLWKTHFLQPTAMLYHPHFTNEKTEAHEEQMKDTYFSRDILNSERLFCCCITPWQKAGPRIYTHPRQRKGCSKHPSYQDPTFTITALILQVPPLSIVTLEVEANTDVWHTLNPQDRETSYIPF